MHLAYAESTPLVESDVYPLPQDTEHWTDRPAHLPLLGFVVASLISAPLWGLIALAAWAVLG